jgi:hypothetical protein
VANRTAADERLGNLCHRSCSLDSSGNSQFFEGILEGQRVNNGCKHPHVVSGDSFNPPLAPNIATENIASSYHNRNFNAKVTDLFNFRGDFLD